MILVVTLNPALDVTHVVDRADWAGVNRPARGARAARRQGRQRRQDAARTRRRRHAGRAGGRRDRASVRWRPARGRDPGRADAGRRRDPADVRGGRHPHGGETALFNEPGPRVSQGEYLAFFVRYEKAVGGLRGGRAVRQPAARAPRRRVRQPDRGRRPPSACRSSLTQRRRRCGTGRRRARRWSSRTWPSSRRLRAQPGHGRRPGLVAIEHAARRLVASATRAAGGQPARPVAGPVRRAARSSRRWTPMPGMCTGRSMQRSSCRSARTGCWR